MKVSPARAVRRRVLCWLGTAGVAITGSAAVQAASTPSDKPPPIAKPAVKLPALTPAVIDNSLAIAGEDIAGKKVDSRMTVAVRIAGRGPYRFVVDSGADTSAVGTRVARELNLPAGTPVNLHGMTANGVVERVLVSDLALGQSLIRDLELPVLRDDDIGAAGLLGIDALVEQRLMMDFDERVITIEDARRKAVWRDGEVVVIARRRRGQLILTQASANGRGIEAVIDTGSEITIGNLAMRDQLVRRTGQTLETVKVTGVTGVTIDMQIARIDELRLGPILLRDVVIGFANVPPFAAFDLNDHPAMLLGTDLMANFRRVSLDFRARKVRFQLKRCKSTGITVALTSSLSRLSSISAGNEACT